ncbi:MAG: NAD(P)/FAD-dependent oxidoreductase [Anaerolineae bacterium]|nr:NAD(P)/FAD-dependent oxidoreductase [Anaerolineae bacterium]
MPFVLSPSNHFPFPGQVAVIGASSAGLFAAALLAQEGLSVRVYEASPDLDPLPRTLIVTSRLPEVLGFLPAEAVLNQVQHIELFSSGASVRLSLRKPDLIVERERVIRLLAERARQAGAEIVCGQRFIGFDALPADAPRSPLRLRFVDGAGDHPRQEQADVVIGADGVHSQVAQAVRVQPSSVALLQAQVVLPPGADPHTVRVWFMPGDTRFFYWLIPQSGQRAVVGLIADDVAQARDRLARFLNAHGLEPLQVQAGAVAVRRFSSRPWATVGGRRVYLVGDAAGQVKMTTVGGLVTGLRGARVAAAAVLGHSGWRSEQRELQRELDLHLLLRLILDRFRDADYDQLLGLLNRRTQDVLATRSRDELARAFWSLPFAQPHLLLLAARVLLRQLRPG